MTSAFARLDHEGRSNTLAHGAWVTNLNPLRLTAGGRAGQQASAFLLRELKRQLLFESPRLVVVDSDLNNNPYVQDAFLADKDNVRKAFAVGKIQVAIRDSACNLFDFNEAQAQRRPDPAMYERTKMFAKEFDPYLISSGQAAFEFRPSELAASFHAMCLRVAKESESPLVADDRAPLLEAIEYGKAKDSRGPLLTDVYEFLVTQRGLPITHPAMEAARTAYMLNAPLNLTFDVSLPTDDIDVSLATFFGASTGAAASAVDDNDHIPWGDRWLKLLPGGLITEAALDKLSFDEIDSVSNDAEGRAYFDALAAAKESLRTADVGRFDRDYEALLGALDVHLRRLSSHAKVDLVAWQDAFVADVEKRIKEEKRLRKGLAIFVPALLPVGAITATIAGAVPAWVIGVAFGVATVVGKSGDYFIDGAAEKRSDRLSLAKGTVHGNFRVLRP